MYVGPPDAQEEEAERQERQEQFPRTGPIPTQLNAREPLLGSSSDLNQRGFGHRRVASYLIDRFASSEGFSMDGPASASKRGSRPLSGGQRERTVARRLVRCFASLAS
jgi:hypothetical protein